LKTSKW